MQFRVMRHGLATVALALAFAGVAVAAEGDEPWSRNASWMTVRVGPVKSLDENAPSGNIGWGFGYRRMLTDRVSLGAAFDHDLLGRFAGASLVEVPASVEMLLHFHWKTPVHPAVGAGFAAVYRKAYRSGDDSSEIQPGGFVTFALHTAVSPHTLVGAECRVMSVSSDESGGNPTFGESLPSSGRTSLKVSISRAYW
jgi:hypothetical protein